MNKRRVVVTGLGAVSSIGIGKDEFWKASVEGRSGVKEIDFFDASIFSSKIASYVSNFEPLDFIEKSVAKRTDRFVHLGLAATRLAIEDSGLKMDSLDKSRVGTIIGSGLGGVLFHEEQILAGYEKGVHRLNPHCVPRISPNAVSGQIAIMFNAQGPNMVISTACSSGNIAIGEAFRKIQYGEADICLTGGVEAPLTQFTFGAYDAMRVLSKRNHAPKEASRPFDKDRDGFVLGEGGGALILEELEFALKRGAKIYAELGGYSLNSGAYNMVIPKPEADDIAKVMLDSIRDASLEIGDIDYINAHGTSTLQNDRAESKAIKDIFKDKALDVNISSTKSMIGHTIAASGAFETIICCLAIENNIIPPTINYTTQDPECDLNYTPNIAVKKTVNNCITNSFGFGSSNSCLILKRFII